jgi:hypothetical protein
LQEKYQERPFLIREVELRHDGSWLDGGGVAEPLVYPFSGVSIADGIQRRTHLTSLAVDRMTRGAPLFLKQAGSSNIHSGVCELR